MLETIASHLPWVDQVGWALLHSLWQGVLVLLAYVLLHRALRHSRPTVRVLLGELSLLTCLLLPIATVMSSTPKPVAAVTVSGEIPAMAARLQAVGSEPGHWLTGLTLAWLGGVVALALRAAWRWRGLRSMVDRAQPLDSAWQRRFRQLCREAGITRSVAWLQSSEVEGPVLIGWLRPVVLFPLGMTLRLPADQIEMLLEHELAHIRRGDFVFNLVQLVVETLLFFHPAVHYIARQVRHDREMACDDRVASRHPNRTGYARALLAVAEMQQPPSRLAMAASGGFLLARIRRIVGEEDLLDREAGGIWRPLGVASLIVLLLAIGSQRAELPLSAIKLPVAKLLQPLQAGIEPALSEPLRIAPPALQRAAIQAPPSESLPQPAPIAPVAASRSQPNLLELELSPAVPTLQRAAIQAPPVAAQSSPPLRYSAPNYPIRARRSGIEGWVDLSYVVGADGRVSQLRIEESVPAGVFDEAALDAMEDWLFTRAAAGEPRRQRFDFNLAEDDGVYGGCELPTGTRVCRGPRE